MSEEQMKVVDWTEYSEPHAGDTKQAKIVEIKLGKLADFKSENYFKKLKRGTPEEVKAQLCMQVRTENNVIAEFILPADKVIPPKSDLGRFKKTYGSLPVVGLTVTTIMDAEGYQHVFLIEK